MDEYIVTVRMTNGDLQVRTLSLEETKTMLEEFFDPKGAVVTFVINKKNAAPLRVRAMQKRNSR